jgi:hypothetical protein
MKLVSIAATDKETVGIVTIREFYAARRDSCGLQMLRQSLRTVVSTQLPELKRIQVIPQGTGDVIEPGLP